MNTWNLGVSTTSAHWAHKPRDRALARAPDQSNPWCQPHTATRSSARGAGQMWISIPTTRPSLCRSSIAHAPVCCNVVRMSRSRQTRERSWCATTTSSSSGAAQHVNGQVEVRKGALTHCPALPVPSCWLCCMLLPEPRRVAAAHQ